MELFTNSKKDHSTEIIEYFVTDVFERYSLYEAIDILYNAGFTKDEILKILDWRCLDSYDWEREEETAPAEETNLEEVGIGDSDRAIFETALTQIGIPYTWEGSRDGDGGWIDLKITDNGDFIGSTAAEIYFTKEGKFSGTY